MNISLVLSFSGWLFCSGVLKKDTTVWLDGARPVNTCIPPFILGNVPVQQQCTHKQKYVCEYVKLIFASLKEFLSISKIWWQHYQSDWTFYHYGFWYEFVEIEILPISLLSETLQLQAICLEPFCHISVSQDALCSQTLSKLSTTCKLARSITQKNPSLNLLSQNSERKKLCNWVWPMADWHPVRFKLDLTDYNFSHRSVHHYTKEKLLL